MNDVFATSPAVLGAVASALLGVLSAVASTRARRNRARSSAAAQKAREHLFEFLAEEVYGAAASGSTPNLSYLVASLEAPVSSEGSSLHSEILDDLQTRLAAMEERLPSAGTLDKLESVNDAILATKIEALERDIKRLSDQSLTKWDVVTVVFLTMSAIGTLVAVIGGAVKLLL